MTSISARVVFGYVALLAILMAIAWMGISMVGKLQESTDSIIDHELAIGLAAQDVRDRITRLRQKEKSFFISIGRRPSALRDDTPDQEFSGVLAKIADLNRALDRFAELRISDDAKRAAGEMRKDVATYQRALTDIYARIQRDQITTARDADDVLIPVKPLVRFDRDGFKNISELPVAELRQAAAEAKVSAKDTATTILLFSALAVIIGMVAAVLTVMRVKRIESASAELRTTLESRVLERTRELTLANEHLTQTLADLASAEDVLTKTEKLTSLGGMVASIAHELNTPIGNALLAASTLQDHARGFRQTMQNGLRRADLEGFIGGVETGTNISFRNLERAADLITNFKQVAADQTSDQRREFNLETVINSVIVSLEPTLRRAEVSVEMQAPPLALDSYPGALIQVLTNLVTNATVHAFEHWTEARGARKIRIAARATTGDKGEGIVVTVADNGNGIPLENQNKVFDHFFTTRTGKGGTGLGLSIVSTLVTGQLGGTIEFSSETGRGTTFTLSMPLVAPPARAT